MSYAFRSYKQVPAPHGAQAKSSASFFSHAARGTVQRKEAAPFFQAKLTVGGANDSYEKEADAVANDVVNRSQPVQGAIQRKNISRIQRLATSGVDEKSSTDEDRMRRDKEVQTKPEIQRMNEGPQEEQEKEKVQMKQAEEEKDEMGGYSIAQTKPDGASAGVASPQLSSRIESTSGRGQALPPGVREGMSASIGHDFSDVNIHTDQQAAAMNRELGAQAFTHGKDIYFNNGKFNPETTEGKKLLAHELTHVVQQSENR
jgi:hypothetical protein